MVTEEQASVRAGRLRRINWRVILGLMVSGVSLYIAVRNLQLVEVWKALTHAHYLWIVPAVALYLTALVARTARWRALLSHESLIPLRELLPTMAIGRGANNIYPFRAGEIVRALLLKRRSGVSGAVGLASILVERVFDGLTMILFLLLAALIGGIPQDVRLLLWLAIAVFGAALGVIYAIVLWPGPIHGVVEWFVARLTPHRFHARLLGVAERFINGFASVRSAGTLTLVLLFSIAVWTAETISYRLLMNSFGFGVDLHHLLLMSGAANLGTALPSGPGNLGTFDAPSILVLTGVGVLKDTAVGYQFLLHAVLWSTETFAGLWCMWRGGLKKADLDRSLGEQRDE
ncbi:MAG: flippase-like domain-containing protein [Anaerolineae bacterium]|nr:flippase-like domain-containing protein [Anaerolineae bacterium]